MTEQEKQAKLDEISEVLREHGFYIAFSADYCFVKIYHGGDCIVDIFRDACSLEIGETDSDKQG